MALQNPFISYIDRSYNQIKQQVLNRLAVLVPEVTDHNESNILVRMLGVWSGIAEMLGYYIDNMARETFLSQTRLYWSGVKIARAYDYRIASAQAAAVVLQIRYDLNVGSAGPFPGVTIPIGSEFQNSDGIRFFTVDVLIIPASTLNTIIANISAQNIEGVSGVVIGVSDGTANQEFELPSDVAGFSVVVISAFVWTGVETLAYSAPADTHFVQTVNESKRVIVRFGDGVNGAIPVLGSNITVNYSRTDGVLGNVAANSVNQAVSPITIPAGFTLTISNPSRGNGGVGVESLVSLKKRVPLLIRTQNRAVTEQDYIDIGNLHPQVAQTAIDYNCGKTVDVYIVPVGGGIASPVILASVLAWYEPRRMVTTRIRVLAAGEIRIQHSIVIRIGANFIQANVVTDVLNALLLFYSTDNQTIGGTLHISDIYQVIEAVQGVQSSTINSVVPVPYGRPNPSNAVQVLSWVPSLQPASTVVVFWELLFVTATTFQLFKDGNFVGTFAVAVAVVQTEIIFTVSGSYTVADRFSFYTYPYSGTDLQLVEPSIPTAIASDILILPIGGLV